MGDRSSKVIHVYVLHRLEAYRLGSLVALDRDSVVASSIPGRRD